MKQHILIEGGDIHVVLQLFMQKRGKKRIVGYRDEAEFKEHFVLNKKEKEGSKSNVLREIRSAVETPDLENLAIICDADEQSVAATWQSISDRLTSRGFLDLPKKMPPEGLIIEQAGRPRVGVWIMPDNEKSAAIEAFFKAIFPKNDPLLARAEKSVADLFAENAALFDPKDAQKAEVATWLAWQKSPGRTMGLALQKNWIAADGALVERFLGWFERVFAIED